MSNVEAHARAKAADLICAAATTWTTGSAGARRSTTARAPSPTSSCASGPSASRSSSRVAARGHRAPVASSARRRTISRASAGGSAAEVRRGRSRHGRSARCARPRRAPRPRRAAARRCGRCCPAARSSTARSAGTRFARTRARAKRGSSLDASSRQLRPRARHHSSVCSRVIVSSGRTSRPLRGAMPSSARRPGEAGEPVEDRLGLVGRGVRGGEHGAAVGGEPGAEAVAHIARPGVQVAGGVGGRSALLDGQRDAELRRRLLAVARVGVGVLTAQAVVDVQRADGAVAAAQQHRDVEQADRVAPAGQQHDDRLRRRQQAGLADALQQV